MREEETGDLVIVTSDRSDMSHVIGPGGYVVGRLREEYGYERVVVQAATDIQTRIRRLKLSRFKVAEEATGNPDLRPLLEGLKAEEARLRGVLPWRYWETVEGPLVETDAEVTVALSGGYDSSATAVLLDLMGYEVRTVTVDPGRMFLPPDLRENVEAVCGEIGAEPRFVEIDLEHVVEGALEEGRFHPCGRCSAEIQSTAVKAADTEVVAFGDGLPTGPMCVRRFEGAIRLNLPAAMAKTKFELKSVVRARVEGFRSYRYGCPFLHQVHERHPHLRGPSVQRILRELRHGFLEVGEALEDIRDVLGGDWGP